MVIETVLFCIIVIIKNNFFAFIPTAVIAYISLYLFHFYLPHLKQSKNKCHHISLPGIASCHTAIEMFLETRENDFGLNDNNNKSNINISATTMKFMYIKWYINGSESRQLLWLESTFNISTLFRVFQLHRFIHTIQIVEIARERYHIQTQLSSHNI